MRTLRCGFMIICMLVILLCLSGCGKDDADMDPSAWGYECKVTYDALGGVINSREVRTTYYLPNSYVYEPSGASGMLIAPQKDGAILAGWYTAKEDVLDADGNVVGYSFRAEDRWDFDLDRVEGDMTLYARWITQGVVSYVDADTAEVLFVKNITADSPIKALSDAVLTMVAPEDANLSGYYVDPECTMVYDFSTYKHTELVMTNAEIYATLMEEFPEAIVTYEATDEEEETSARPYYFLEKEGYTVVTEDEEVLAAIRARKDALIEENIALYSENTSGRNVYLKFSDGNYVVVQSVEDLKQGRNYVLGGADIDGYIIAADIDFTGITLSVADSFTGTIEGNGHTFSNLTIEASVSKKDKPGTKSVALCKSMKDVVISNLTLDGVTLTANANDMVELHAAVLAAEATNCTFSGCHFSNWNIYVSEEYSAGTIVLGDLFVESTDCVLENCTYENITLSEENAATINKLLP